MCIYVYIYIYIVGLYSLYYLSLLITVTQDPSCFLSHLNIRAKIVLNVFKEFFTFKDIQRLYRIRLLVAMAIGRHLLLFKLGPLTPHEVCSGALTLHPGLELRAKKMRQT